MDKRIVGTLLGIAGILLWFMPWTQFSIGEMEFARTGSHVGGIAYVLLMSSLAYAVLSWVTEPVPRIIVAALSTLLSSNFWLDAGEAAAWGLVGLCMASGISLLQAIEENRAFKRAEKQT
ncbi:MAG: hypothetical protein RBS57_11740 [Desulforhabdus sp.]|jgi:di/tricarboxylate transporter|nr:hypothetical protein [Desulforhabdus sp.]